MRDLLSKLDRILTESALQNQDDLKAKRKALSDLEADPVASKDPEISAAIDQRRADLEREAKSKGFEESLESSEGFAIGDAFGISFSEDFEIGAEIVDILEDGIVIELDDDAMNMLVDEGFSYEDGELAEGVAGAQKCWKGFRKVGTKAGTGANAGKRVNDCEKIDEYFQFDFPEKKDRGPRDSGQDELARREKSFRKHELAKDGRDYKDAMSPKSKSPFKGKYDIAGPKGKLPEDAVEESGLQYHTGVKKHGKEYMVKAAAAGREGASQKELGALKDKYSKAYKEDSVSEAKSSVNFDADDLARLQNINDLDTIKTQAFELISKPSKRPMKPEKVEWFKNSLERMQNKNAVIKLMYDLLLSGEGSGVIGTRSSMGQNSYRQRFGDSINNEQGEEGFSIEDMVMDQYRNGNDVSEIASNMGMDESEVQDIIDDGGQGVSEAEYQGRKVQLGKKMAGDVKKSKVYVKNPQGNVVKVNFGDKKMKIKKSNPARRKSFRARHNCANPGPRHKARYWSCRSW